MEVAASLGLDGQLDFIDRGLQSKDWSMRAKACQLAASIGPAAAPSSAAQLTEVMLSDGDSEVRHAAVLAMQTFPGEFKAEAVRRLCVDGLRYELESLNSSRRNVKSAACAAFALLGHDVGLPYLQDVQACLRDRSSLVKKHAATVLAAWGSPVAQHENAHAVIQELGRMAIGDRDPTVRAASCDALGSVLEGAPELPPLPRPEDEEAEEVGAEATAEGDAKPPEEADEEGKADAEAEDAEAQPRARARTDTDEELQPLAVSVRYIARLLQSDEYASVRRAAAAALGTIGGDVSAAQAECLFVATLQDPSKEVRLTAAAALTKLGGLYTQQIAEALAMALEGGEDDLATKLAALRTQGPCALPHAMAVGTALLDVDEDVRELAALTLLSVEFPDGEALSPASPASPESASPEVQSPSEKVIPRLMNTALQDKVPHVQLAAIRVLEALSGRIGIAEYAAQLAGALQSEHVAARWGAMRALRALGTDAMTTYARELAILVSDDSWYVRTLATELVHELGPLGAERSQPVLSKALHSLDQEVRRNAALALGKQAKVASKHAGALCTRMLGNRPGVTSDDPDADLSERLEVRTACMWALGQLEPEAVMPHIHNLDDGLFHRNPRYRLVATQALANLGPKAIQSRKDHLMVMESTDRDDDVRGAAAAALRLIGL